jgi:NAD-dependent dihydropyrimidine dehydrogenase PreA subunit
MAHVITALCLRDGACADVCPVECIVGGKPEDQFPWFYIDPNTCIDCGACVPECPFEAIFPADEVPESFELKAGQKYQRHGEAVAEGAAGEAINLTEAAAWNAYFYSDGAGYGAKNM